MSTWFTDKLTEERRRDAEFATEGEYTDAELEEIAARGRTAARALQRRRMSRLVAQALPSIEAGATREKRSVLKTIKGSHMSADRSEMQPWVRIAVEELIEEGLVVEKERKDGKRILQYQKPAKTQ